MPRPASREATASDGIRPNMISGAASGVTTSEVTSSPSSVTLRSAIRATS
jgi:hypothetical protein